MTKIGILGAGTWGTALARMLCNTGSQVTVWSAISSEIDHLSAERVHPNLPGMTIPEEIIFTKELSRTCEDQDLLLFAVPSVYVRSTAAAVRPYVKPGQLVADVAKGIEPGTLMFMTEVIRDALGVDVRAAALSGPTHAEEVALDLPTTIVSAAEDMETAAQVQDIFMNTCMRVYTNTDVRGVELCGALKNVVALAAGISDGMGYGDNAKAAIITRGLAEITRLGKAMGCREQTFAGLAGVGDLIVTATSRHSRNNRCGCLIGEGVSPKEAVARVGMVVEGVNALPAAMELRDRYGVEMPLMTAVDLVVNGGGDPRAAVRSLMDRDRKAESGQLMSV